ncbi:MAG: 50S ribosomal protein L19 [Patescibacteria group bacterium]
MAFKISPVDVTKRAKLDLRAGYTVRVWQKIQEKGKTRLQAFEGLVIARKHGKEAGGTFTVRRIVGGIGVEKILPIYSPNIDKIEVLKKARVRRSKLYYVREKAAKEVRRQMRNLFTTKAEADEVLGEETEKVETKPEAEVTETATA